MAQKTRARGIWKTPREMVLAACANTVRTFAPNEGWDSDGLWGECSAMAEIAVEHIMIAFYGPPSSEAAQETLIRIRSRFARDLYKKLAKSCEQPSGVKRPCACARR